ncbi:uncharacterized protein ACA1_220110 [Acanthamoeba castellanii str. Neff]|uniref:Uncharacterized protein n=1 Tax=Acanthamoeba castellanii (strain ATCC 30010 / Neff) TaxID=1257118 RepID=L8GRK0_ACACF|nr:uncharacterized protein ACA1_220110 [Acanthamoeba castellanii str. Neff]ELR15273.1 hypothetical protein ACA1_220110 [Acanthamoeba castellanii str. Neff]
MGNVQVLKEKAVEEYQRVKALQPRSDEYDYLTIQDLLRVRLINVVREYSVDFCHLGTLYVLDRHKRGRFDEDDFLEFIDLCFSQENSSDSNGRQSTSRGDFQTQFQAYCTWQMWNAMVNNPNGEQKWGREGKKFSSLTGGAGAISRSDAEAAALALTAAANSAMPAAELLSRGTVQLIHKILNIKKAYGVDDREFFNLMQRAAEEMVFDWMNLENEDLDEYVPILVMHQFASDFVKGFVNLMFELGFESA